MLLAGASNVCLIRAIRLGREDRRGQTEGGGCEGQATAMRCDPLRCDPLLAALRCAHSCRILLSLSSARSFAPLPLPSPTSAAPRCGRRLCDADTRSWRTQRDHSRTPRMHSQRQERDQDRTVRQADPRPPLLLWAAPIAIRTRPSTPATRAAPSDLPPAAAVVAAWAARRRQRSLRR